MELDNPVFSIAIPVHLLSDPAVSATAKLLYGVIESFQRKSGVCFATNDRLAEQLGGCTARTITKCITELKDADYIIVDPGKTRKIYLSTSFPDGHEGRKNFLPSTKKISRGVEENFQEGRKNFLPSNIESNTESKKEKKEKFDCLSVFVDWIRTNLGERCSPDQMNAVYLKLVEYKDMRADSKSPLNTQRKVDGLLEDLLEGSQGNPELMCQMLTTAKRRCWLSVHPPNGEKNYQPENGEGRARRWLSDG